MTSLILEFSRKVVKHLSINYIILEVENTPYRKPWLKATKVKQRRFYYSGLYIMPVLFPRLQMKMKKEIESLSEVMKNCRL